MLTQLAFISDILSPQQPLFRLTVQHEMLEHPIRIQCQQPFQTVSSKVPKRKKIIVIPKAINRITLKIESKMSDQCCWNFPICIRWYTWPATCCKMSKLQKPAWSMRKSRGYSNNNADSEHENLDITQQKIANLEKLFDQQSHSLQYLTSAVKRLAKTAKPKNSKRKKKLL